MALFSRIKETARKRGWSLQHTAIKAGLSINTIYGWKTKKPAAESIQAVADVLHVSVDYLLGNTDDPSPAKRQSNDDPVDLAGTHIFTYQGRPVSKEDWEVIQAILKRHDEDGD